jgi:hypothetical protein
MACYLRPTPPSPEAAEQFERERDAVMRQAHDARCGRVQRECVSVDGRTLILIFENGTQREVTMPTADEVFSFSGYRQ